MSEHKEKERRDSSDMSAEEFRIAGHRLVDALAEFYESLPDRSVSSSESVSSLRAVFPPGELPVDGRSGADLLAEITPLLIDHSLHNGHPRFFGYITSSAAPLGALADLLAAGINQNCGLRQLSPAANEIEMQAVNWLAELIGFPTPCGGIMVSGGNMANILAFLAARSERLDGDLRTDGLFECKGRPRVYASSETHTWIQKAADISGIGIDAIRWISTDSNQRMLPDALSDSISEDREAGDLPFLIVATAGNVSTGAIDPLDRIAGIAQSNALWFHVDGAYGGPAAALPEAPDALKALALADSVALDPHKWLYNPIEAACTLVRKPDALSRAFGFSPPYYRLGDADDEGGINYFEHGLQNTRGFRALKVWLCLQQAGRTGYQDSIRANIGLAHRLFEKAEAARDIEAGTQNLSITTFRFRPAAFRSSAAWVEYLDRLNQTLLAELQSSGRVYLSNALLDGRYFLRACIVNFRTRESDIDALIDIVASLGRQIDEQERPEGLKE